MIFVGVPSIAPPLILAVSKGFVGREFCFIGTHPPIRKGFQSRFFGVPRIAPPPILAVSDQVMVC